MPNNLLNNYKAEAACAVGTGTALGVAEQY